MQRWILAPLFAAGAALSLWGAYTVWQDTGAVATGLTAETVPTGKSARWYASVTVDAMKAREWSLARVAATAETEAAPDSPAAWHRLSLASAMEAGAPDAQSLAALMTAYEVAPYPAPADMVWRVEFAARYWSAMPDPVQALTLTQIEALGGIGTTWDTRAAWCREFPDGALADAACATVPGVVRGN